MPERDDERQLQLARLIDAMVHIARSAPAKPGQNVYAAKIPWPRITELRDALDAADISWRGEPPANEWRRP